MIESFPGEKKMRQLWLAEEKQMIEQDLVPESPRKRSMGGKVVSEVEKDANGGK
jgi:hypothetical protein